ncbi:MAG: hypothetical protein AAF493_25295 [Pseudomonadota bacterium]
MDKHVLVVMTNPVEGRDQAFNEWYTDTHIGEVLEVNGFKAAQRFQLADATFAGQSDYRYLAIYEIETDNLQGALDALKAAVPGMVMSDAMAKGAGAWAFTPITARVGGDQRLDLNRGHTAIDHQL